MQRLTVEAHAKINLTLEVLGRRPDGYHDLRSVVGLIDLHDDVGFADAPDGAVTVEGCADVPEERNLAWRAAMALRRAAGVGRGASLRIVKRIPMGAGLGGGSADAAAALHGLNALWNLGWPVERLCAVGAEVGSDVPVLVLLSAPGTPPGAVALMEGRGERVRLLAPGEADAPAADWRRGLVVRAPGVFSSTAATYGEFREEDRGRGPNDLQSAACRLCPAIADALRELRDEGCRDVRMSGSGSAVFGWMPAPGETPPDVPEPPAGADAAKVRALSSPLERLAWGTDASCYRLTPEEVLFPADESEVAAVLARARREGKKVTFRAAGTSLSGQSTTDSLLMVCGKGWEGHEVLDGGRLVRLQPGVVGARVNEILRPFGRCFTPDPASIASAMVGGIVANNASGMCCGTHANAERMIRSVRLVLADGTVLDTGDAESRRRFAATHPALLARLVALRDQVRGDAALRELIQRKYAIKNVTGLTILPFAECEDPFEIITRLIPGSEGTLAFLSSATFETGAIAPLSRSELRLYPTARAACEAVAELALDPRVAAAEFFDRASMRVVEKDFPELAGQPPDAAALLVRINGEAETDPARAAKWWAMRSGIFPAVGGSRPVGTACLIEDVAVPVARLADFTDDLRGLFAEHGFGDAVIYGHALAGNWHFILSPRFDTPEAVARYGRMMGAVAELVAGKYGGSLKAEHGTGRNMAPFVRREWGDAAWRLMRDVKDLFDPEGILGPGVVFNSDPGAHVRHLKQLPHVHELVDRCIECGFCEVNCTACGFSLSSRQRIAVQREIARLRAAGDGAGAVRLERAFRRPGRDLCAGDGLCATSCPVRINVGEFIHVVRERELGRLARVAGEAAAAHLRAAGGGVKALLALAALGHRVLGTRLMSAVCRALHRQLRIPLWTPAMPEPVRGARRRARGAAAHAGKVVYFPSCINQRMGRARGDAGNTLVQDMEEVFAKAGYETVRLAHEADFCCGLTWESKGQPGVADRKTEELAAALRAASENGRWPVVCDQSPCLMRLRSRIRDLKIYGPAEFFDRFLLDRLELRPVDACVALHVTCSTRKMGLADALVRVARRCAREVVLPEGVGCCAFAGDKGFTAPELNAWALRKLRAGIAAAGATRGYSNSRTCEIGLSTHGGIPYKGLASLVNEAAVGPARSDA